MTPAQRSQSARHAVRPIAHAPLKNEEDEYKWSKETVEAIRAGDFAAIDMDALLDEMESAVSRMERELFSTVGDILEALLWREYTNAPPPEIDAQLIRAQVHLESILESAPSLRELLAGTTERAYKAARVWVTEAYAVTLPNRCPFPLERIMEDPIARLASHGRLV